MSDDSHGIEQVGYGYKDVLAFLKEARIDELYYLQHVDTPEEIFDDRFPNTVRRRVSMTEVERHPFWVAVN